jgi:hypothetical protein
MGISAFFGSGGNPFFDIITPFASPVPVGSGGAYDASVLPEKNNTFCVQVITEWECRSGGAKPPGASDGILNRFLQGSIFF